MEYTYIWKKIHTPLGTEFQPKHNFISPITAFFSEFHSLFPKIAIKYGEFNWTIRQLYTLCVVPTPPGMYVQIKIPQFFLTIYEIQIFIIIYEI